MNAKVTILFICKWWQWSHREALKKVRGGSGVWTRQFPTSFKASLVCRCTIKLKSLYQTQHSNSKNGRILAMISATELRSTMWGSVMRTVRKEKKETLPRNAKRMVAFLNVVWGMKTSTRELCGTKGYQHQKLQKAMRFFYSLSSLPASVIIQYYTKEMASFK